MDSGVVSVVLRGCISFNPMYREHSLYSPKLFRHCQEKPSYNWERQTLFSQYRQYLRWLISYINEFELIEYVELFNEYFFKGANYIPFNKLLVAHLMAEWRALVPYCRPVLWGISEPLIGTLIPDNHIAIVDNWRRELGLGYTGIQVHQRADMKLVERTPYPIAITENYSGLSCSTKGLIYYGY